MGRLLMIQQGAIGTEWRLQPGLNRIGRLADNDVQIADPSLSGHHCEIFYQAENIAIRDLGSTNGTFLDKVQVQEAALRSGQTIKLGNVELLFDNESQPVALEAPPKLVTVPAANRVIPPAHEPANTVETLRTPQTFFQALPTIFSYPLRKRGPILLITGTVFFLLIDSATMMARYAPLFGLVAVVFLAICGGGFLFAFMQDIITSSAAGEDMIPGWPDVSEIFQDLVQPFFRFTAIWVVCLLPGFLLGFASPPLGGALLLVGVFCLPMALLTVSMADSISGLNPMVIFPSIMKVPGAYVIACLLLLVIIAIQALSKWLLGLCPIPLIPTIVGKVLSLYVLILEMRILGLLYRFNAHRLRWF